MKLVLSIFILTISFLFLSCKDEISNNIIMPDTSEKGNIIVTSDVPGVKIYIQNTFSGKVTPDTLRDLSPGEYSISLKPREYASVTRAVEVKNKLYTSINIPLEKEFGRVVITSYPDSCQIFINDVNTGQITPDTVDYIHNGSYYYDLLTLKKGSLVYSNGIYSSYGTVNKLNFDLTARLSISSEPSGADIYMNNIKTGKRTPYQFTKLVTGNYDIKLKFAGYLDTTLTMTLESGDNSLYITLMDSIKLSTFGPVKLYAFSNSTTQKQGVDLSTGETYVFNSSLSYSYVDMYYSGDGLSLNSPYDYSYKNTRFTDGYGSNLLDTEDSPSYYYGTWNYSMAYDNPDYFFAYDSDGHYSKVIVTNSGGTGAAGDPKWIEIEWLYNNKYSDRRF